MNNTLKKFFGFILVLILAIQFIACSSVKYYENTKIPTFTSVTKIKVDSEKNISGYVGYIYKCESGKRKEYANQYIDYLKNECGFEEFKEDGLYDCVTLTNGDSSVLVDPYYSNDSICILPSNN